MKNFRYRRHFTKQRTYATLVFLAIQVVIYLLMTFSGGSTSVINLIFYGAKFNPAILAGQYWRFITPIFIHIGFTHILLNSITLYYLGSQLELLYGSWRFILIYLFGGLMGNIMSFAFSDAISAGASTSLFGLFAATIVLGRLYPHNYALKSMAQGFTILIILNFIVGLTSPGIDNWGHFGGAVGGALAAVFVPVPRLASVSKSSRAKAMIAFIVVAGLLVMFGFWSRGRL